MEMTPTVQFIIGVYSSFLVSSYVGFDSTRACPVKCTIRKAEGHHVQSTYACSRAEVVVSSKRSRRQYELSDVADAANRWLFLFTRKIIIDILTQGIDTRVRVEERTNLPHFSSDILRLLNALCINHVLQSHLAYISSKDIIYSTSLV